MFFSVSPQDSRFALQKVLSIFKHQHYSSALHLPSGISPGVYACHVWAPHTSRDINTLESVQKVACKMMSDRWSGATDEDLLIITNLPTLERRRLELKLHVSSFQNHSQSGLLSKQCIYLFIEKGHIIIFVHPMSSDKNPYASAISIRNKRHKNLGEDLVTPVPWIT